MAYSQKEIKRNYEKCENCGGNLFYNPNLKALSCENCSSVVNINAEKILTKHHITSAPQDNSNYEDWKNSSKVIKCKNCGATIVLNNLEYAKTCPYCDSPYVGEVKELPSFVPDGIIPFQFDEKTASEKFRASVKNKFLVPKAFKKNIPENQIKGVYIPSFVFDANSVSTYSGTLSESETHHDSDGHSHTTTRTFHISGTQNCTHKDVIVESSSHITQAEIQALLPFSKNQIVKFNQDFIMGYVVEHFSTPFPECVKQSKSLMLGQIRKDILSKYHYDFVNSLTINPIYSDELFHHTIYPVYQFSYTYKDKSYTTFMNGETGKIGKGLPISGGKIALIVLIVLAVFVIPFIIFVILSILGTGVGVWFSSNNFSDFLIK